MTLAVRQTENTGEIQRSVSDVVGMTRLVQEILGTVMIRDTHYGTIPGCGDKPTLLKAGAEKLCVTFRLAARPTITRTEFPNGHREYEVVTKLIHIPSGECWGEGVGVCSTMESKYRWRGGARLCPECGKGAIKRSKFPPKGQPNAQPGYYCYAKVGGCGANFDATDKRLTDQSEERQENPDIADQWNTVLKMAKKRSLVDATLTATAASDLFAQDLEELAETEARVKPINVEIVEQDEAPPQTSKTEQLKAFAAKRAAKAPAEPMFSDEPELDEVDACAVWVSKITSAETVEDLEAILVHARAEHKARCWGKDSGATLAAAKDRAIARINAAKAGK